MTLGDNAGDRAIWHRIPDRPILTREPEHDAGPDWAWRLDPARCDTTCRHPLHVFGLPHGTGHLEWFPPGTDSLIPTDDRQDYP